MNPSSTPDASSRTEQDILPITRLYMNVAYALFVVGWLFPPLLLAGLAINLLRRGKTAGTWLESHFRHQLKWFLILMGVALGLILLMTFGSGGAYLLGAVVSTGNMDSDTAMLIAYAPLILLILAIVVYEIKMLGGWSDLRLRQSVG